MNKTITQNEEPEEIVCPRCKREVPKESIICPFCKFGILAWTEGEIDENGHSVKK